MADTAPAAASRLTVRQFLEWEARQPARYELADGLVRMMAGGTRRHARIQTNVLAALRAQLRGQRCEAFGSDFKVLTDPGAVYYPDVSVDCGAGEDDALIAAEPTVIFEVLPKSTRDTDLTEKLPNYQATTSV